MKPNTSLKVPDGLVKIRKLKTDREHNNQYIKSKETNNDVHNTTYKTKD